MNNAARLPQTPHQTLAGNAAAAPAATLRVAHVVLTMNVGGLERVVLDLIRQGLVRQQQPSVICLGEEGSLAPQVRAMGVPLDCAHKSPGLSLQSPRQLEAILRQTRPDVIHTHQIGALFYAGRAARHADIPAIIHTEHGRHFDRLQTRWLGRFATRYVDQFCCVSDDLAEHVRSHRIVAASKLRVVRNGIDVERFTSGADRIAVRQSLGIPENAPVIGTIGRLSEVKRQDLLLRGFATAQRIRPDAQLLIVGSGPMETELKALAEELGITAAVHFAGYQSAPERYLSAMDVFALTSRSEGMPLAVLEAWAAGVPVVASAVGGVPELVRDGVTGLLFPSGDDKALAGGLQALMASSALAGLLAKNAGRRVAAEFSLARMAATYEEHYRSSLRISRPGTWS